MGRQEKKTLQNSRKTLNAHLVLPEEFLQAVSALIRFNTGMPHTMAMHICLLTELHMTDITLIHLSLVTFVGILKFQEVI